MIEFVADADNALQERDFQDEHRVEGESPAPIGQDLEPRFTSEPAEPDAPGQEIEAIERRTLSPAQYLAWLEIEQAKALRIVRDYLGLPRELEPPDEPDVRPLSPDLPPLERRLFEVLMRLGRENRDLARGFARVIEAKRDAFDPGLKTPAQGH